MPNKDLTFRLLGEDAGATKAVEGVTERAKTAFEGMAQRAEASAERFHKGFGSAYKVIGGIGLAAGATALAIGGAALKGASDAEQSNLKMAGSLGLTAQQAAKFGRLAGDVYSQNYGESMEQVQDTIGNVVSGIKGMRTASDRDVEGMTSNVLSFASAFDVEASDAIQQVNELMASKLAKSGPEALDLLTSAMQRVPKAVRGDLMDAVDEYAPFMHQLGLSGAQSMQLLVDSTGKGMYGLDKTGDALKEFTIRSTDMSKSSTAAYRTLGLDAHTMANDILAGGKRASGGLDTIVDRLLKIKDPATRSNTAIALFGTQMEDLGVGEVPKFLSSLRKVGGGLDDTKGAASRLSSTIGGGASNSVEAFHRKWDVVTQRLVQGALPALTSVFTFLGQHEGLMKALVVGLGLVAVAAGVLTAAVWAVQAATVLSSAATVTATAIQKGAAAASYGYAGASYAVGGAQKAVYGATLLLNGALYANIAASARSKAESAALYAMYAREAVVAKAKAVASFVETAASATVNAAKTGAAWIAQAARSGAVWVAMKAKAVVAFAETAASAVVNGARMAAVWVAQKAAVAGYIVVQGLLKVATVAGTAAQWLLNAAMDANPIGIVVVAIAALVAGLVWFFTQTKVGQQAWSGFVGFLKSAWEGFTSWIGGALKAVGAFFVQWGPMILAVVAPVIGLPLLIISHWGEIVGFFQQLGPKIIGFLSGAARWLVDTGTNLLSGLLTGVKTGWTAVTTWFGGINAKVLAILAGAAKWLVDTGSDVLQGLLTGAKTGLVNLVTWTAKINLKVLQALAGAAKWLVDTGSDVLHGLLTGAKNALVVVALWVAGLNLKFIGWLAGAARWLVDTGSDVLHGLLTGAKNALVAVATWVTGLNLKFIGWLAGAGQWLLNIGGQIIGGLINGLKGAVGHVKDFFVGLTKDIPNWKGPAETDRKLLTPAGHMLIGGLVLGLNEKRGDVRTSLSKLTSDVGEKTKAGLDASTPKVFRATAAWVSEGLIKGLKGTGEQVSSAMGSLTDRVKKAFDGLADQREAAQKRLKTLDSQLGDVDATTKAGAKRVAAIKEQIHAEQTVLGQINSASKIKRSALLDHLSSETKDLQVIAKQRDALATQLKTAQKTLTDATSMRDDFQKATASKAVDGGDAQAMFTKSIQDAADATTSAADYSSKLQDLGEKISNATADRSTITDKIAAAQQAQADAAAAFSAAKSAPLDPDGKTDDLASSLADAMADRSALLDRIAQAQADRTAALADGNAAVAAGKDAEAKAAASSQQSAENTLTSLARQQRELDQKITGYQQDISALPTTLAATQAKKLSDAVSAQRTADQQMTAATKDLRDFDQSAASYASDRDALAAKLATAQSTAAKSPIELMVQNLKDQVGKTQEFAKLLAQLKGQGLDDTTYAEIVGGGVDQGLATAQALAADGTGAVHEIATLQGQLNTAAESLGDATSKTLYQAGVDEAQAHVKGLTGQITAVTGAVGVVEQSIAQAVSQLGINTSALSSDAGHKIGDALAVGAADRKAALGGTVDDLSKHVAKRVKSLGLDGHAKAKKAGHHVVSGLKKGMKEKGDFTSLFDDMSDGMIKSLRKSLGIKSPSTRFRDEVGVHIPAGVGVGVKLGRPDLDREVAAMVNVPRVATAPGSVGLPGQIPGAAAGGQRPLVHIDNFHATPSQSPADIAADLGWLTRGGL